jgi:hypothetical protein
MLIFTLTEIYEIFAKNLSVKVCVICKPIDLSKRAESNVIGFDIEVSINFDQYFTL